MVKQREAEAHAEAEIMKPILARRRRGQYDDPIQDKANAAWAVNAYRSYLRISAKTDGCHYSN